MRWRRPRRPGWAVLCALAVVGVAWTPPLAGAALDDVGHQGPDATAAGPSPTGEKPESKLWWNDGFWWASMWDADSASFHIFRLAPATQRWIDTGTPIDDRAHTRADALWDNRAKKLYLASHLFSGPDAPASGPGRLYRFSYDAVKNRYSRDGGFPATINTGASEALVIDKDSKGRVWATWVQAPAGSGHRLMIAWSADGGRSWESFQLADGLHRDDIATLVAFGRNKIGVMWSNQVADDFYFAVHDDADPPKEGWSDLEAPLAGTTLVPDDHINVKADRAGRVFAAVKTDSDPLTMLLVRSVSGTWTRHAFGRDADHHTRPIVLLDEANQVVHMIATSPETGASRAIYEKTSPMGSISFPGGLGTPVLRAAGWVLNDATSTKQSLSGATGRVVLATATAAATRRYWHAHRSLGSSSPSPPAGKNRCTIVGTPGDDDLRGTPRRDVICGRGGDDVLRGGRGGDVLRGGSGADRLVGGRGRDVFRGGRGQDVLIARDGRRELVDGGPGRDRARVDRGRDTLRSIEKLL